MIMFRNTERRLQRLENSMAELQSALDDAGLRWERTLNSPARLRGVLVRLFNYLGIREVVHEEYVAIEKIKEIK